MSKSASRRGFLYGVAVLPTVGATSLAATRATASPGGLRLDETPDPIFAVIEENRRAYAAWQATNALPEVPVTIDRPPEALDAAEAFHEQTDTVLLTTVPTTAAGCQALTRYVAEFQDREGFSLDEDDHNRENCRVLALIAQSPLL